MERRWKDLEMVKLEGMGCGRPVTRLEICAHSQLMEACTDLLSLHLNSARLRARNFLMYTIPRNHDS